MAKTSLEVIDLLFPIVRIALFSNTQAPNGNLYKTPRPANSKLEDVVISSLGLNREDVQRGIFNVNIYVPNLEIPVNGVIDLSQPNFDRLKFLATVMNDYFRDEIWDENGDFCFNIQQDRIFEDEGNQHYVNFRIEFNSGNIYN